MKEEMAIEISNLYEDIKSETDRTEVSERTKLFINLYRLAEELENKKTEIYLELEDGEREDIEKILEINSRKTGSPESITVRDVSKILEVSPQMVRRYCSEGKIEARQRIEGSGTWIIPSSQFVNHPNWTKFVRDKNKLKKQSIEIAEKMLRDTE